MFNRVLFYSLGEECKDLVQDHNAQGAQGQEHGAEDENHQTENDGHLNEEDEPLAHLVLVVLCGHNVEQMIDEESRDVEEDLNHGEEGHDDDEDGVNGLAAQRAESGHQRDEVVSIRGDVLGDLKTDQVVSEGHLEVWDGLEVDKELEWGLDR